MAVAVRPARKHAGAQAVLFCCLLSAVGVVNAMWAGLGDEELVRSSDLIVMGEWQGQTTLSSAPAVELETGVIIISEVLKGVGNPAFALVALPANKALRSSSDPDYRRGDRGLWLLRARPNSKGLYLVDHPQRFVPAVGGENRIRQLRRLIAP
jgi:hypothetical protein